MGEWSIFTEQLQVQPSGLWHKLVGERRLMTEGNCIDWPHSAEYFGEDRDFFWNADFLDLLACRLNLSSVERALDVGCGVGHWSRLLLPRLAPSAQLVGVDRESSHVADFTARLKSGALDGARMAAVEGDATALPLPDSAFDLATCQTLLLHLQDPALALREMIRVTRPGGLILCVEPNNLVARLPFNGLTADIDPERLVRLSELAWRYVIGRARRGFGAEFIGELLPGLFDTLGLQQIEIWLSDRAAPLIPPYSTVAERAALATSNHWRDEGIGPYARDEMRANVLAGGGSEAFFEAAWEDYLALDSQAGEAIAHARWYSSGGALFYIVAGRKI